MRRTLIAVLAAGLLAVVGGGLVWYLSYDMGSNPPQQVAVAGLVEAATLTWHEHGSVTVEAPSTDASYRALGLAHGLQRAWTLSLWRQTATGRLAERFGAALLPFDRHARRLGLAQTARAAYRALSPAQQARLQAYADGVNAAFQHPYVRHQEAFVLLDVTPAPWEPWHSLAVERLFAWLASTLPPRPSDAPALRAFYKQDARFRDWLHVHGLDRSVAWAVRDSAAASSTLFQRHTYGTSARPLYETVRLRRGDRSVTLATLPGTPFAPAGWGTHAWALLPGSPVSLTRDTVASVDTSYTRLRTADGTESLLAVPRVADALPLGVRPAPSARRPAVRSSSPPPPSADSLSPSPVDASPVDASPVDSLRASDPGGSRRAALLSDSIRDAHVAWMLRWPGFTPVTDLAAWERLVHRDTARGSGRQDTVGFRLFDGTGLLQHRDGQWTVLGRPPVVERMPDGLFVGRSRWARAQGDALAEHLRRPGAPVPARWSASDSSTWAARLMRRMLPDLRAPLETAGSAPAATALAAATTYLRNWDHTYDRASIGATVFDAWMRAYRQEIGPEAALGDSVYFAGHRRRLALRRATQRLVQAFGPDPQQWRWEQANRRRLAFPVWAADSLVNADLSTTASTRYAPIVRAGQGHPSVLAGGTGLVDTTRPAPAAWAGWGTTRPSADRPVQVRRFRPNVDAFFGRYLTGEGRPAPVPVGAGDGTTTRLVSPR